MAIEPIAIGLKVGVDILQKVAPAGLGWIATKFFGVSILAVGERRAGKSSFVNYFEHGFLLPPNTPTPRTLEVRNTASFNVAIGREKSLRMRVSKVTDTRGHDSIKEQVSLIVRRKPNVLMIFLDVSRDWDVVDEDYGIIYLKGLLDELNVRTLRVKGVSAKMQHLCIVLNKKDHVDDKEYKKKNEKLNILLQQFSAPNWGPGQREISVFPCIAVENDNAVKHLDEMIKSIITTVMLKVQ